MKVVIQQGTVPTYRVPFFDGVSRVVSKLRVVHSGPPVVSADKLFEEVRVPVASVAGIHIQSGLERALEGFDVRVVMYDVHWLSSIRILRRETGIRTLLWGHGLGRHHVGRMVRLRLIEQADGVVLYHERQAKEFVALGIHPQRVFVASNTVQVERQHIVQGKPRSFLHVGRIQTRKRLDVALRAYAQVLRRSHCQGLHFDIVGGGEELSALRTLTHTLDIEKSVTFHGPVFERDKIATLFSRAICFICPGALGLGMLEAFAHGVPVLVGSEAHHGPEVQDLGHGEHGFRLPLRPASFADGMLTLLQHNGMRERMGKACLDFYWRHRRMEQMVDGFAKALEGR